MADSDSGTHISDITENSPEDFDAKNEGNKALIDVIFASNINNVHQPHILSKYRMVYNHKIFCKNFVKTVVNIK